MTTAKEILKYHKFAYMCSCGQEYGSDKEEKGEHICPICEDKNRE